MPGVTLKNPAIGTCLGGLLFFVSTYLLQNVVQENTEIIYFDLNMITITKSFSGYIFSSWKHVSVFFEDFELITILFPMN